MVKKFTGELCPIGGKTTEKKEAVKSHVLSPDWSSVLTNENKGFLQGWIQIDPKKTAKKFDKIIGIIQRHLAFLNRLSVSFGWKRFSNRIYGAGYHLF